MSNMKKVVVATLYRFGSAATVICETEKEAREKLMAWYTEEYVHLNGTNPKEDVYLTYFDEDKETYYDEADSCIEIEEYVLGEIDFR